MNTPKVSIRLDDLRDLVTSTLPAAGKDDELPALRCVLLEKRGDQLLAIATDRFRAHFARRPLVDGSAGTDGAFRTAIPGWALKRAVAMFGNTAVGPTVTIELHPDRRVTVSCSSEDAVTSSITMRAFGGDYPDVAKVIAKALAAPAADRASEVDVNPAYLADLHRAAGTGSAGTLLGSANGTGALIFVLDDGTFGGLVMPRRRTYVGGDVTPPQVGWLRLLGNATTTDEDAA